MNGLWKAETSKQKVQFRQQLGNLNDETRKDFPTG